MESEFVDVAAVEDIPQGGAISVRVGWDDIALFESGGRIYALEDRCPHQGVPLSEGDVEDEIVRCWYHGWEFELCSGRCLTYEAFPATPFEVRVEGGRVWVRRRPGTAG